MNLCRRRWGDAEDMGLGDAFGVNGAALLGKRSLPAVRDDKWGSFAGNWWAKAHPTASWFFVLCLLVIRVNSAGRKS